MHAGWAQWQLGFPDQALATTREVVALSERLGHPFSRAIAAFGLSQVNMYLRAAPEAEAWAQTMIEACEQYGFPHYLSVAHVMHGWSLAVQDRCAEGVAEIDFEEVLSAIRRIT